MPKLALIQLKAHEDPQINIQNTKKAIERAADSGAQIVCTQELFSTQYFCVNQSAEPFAHAEVIPGDLSRNLGQLAADLGIIIVASMFEKRTKGMYHNTAIVINTDGTLMGKYRKIHIPQDSNSDQKYYFTQGEDGYQVFDTKFGKLGILISWDQWFPEAARINALMGADIIIYPNSLGCLSDEISDKGDAMHDTWQTVLRTHAITNGCYIAAINRVGIEGDIEFWGRSFVSDHGGNIIAEGHEMEDSIVYADADLEAIAEHRCHWPFFRDRRIDTYDRISERLIEVEPEDESKP